jgi:glutamine cyclotransferase
VTERVPTRSVRATVMVGVFATAVVALAVWAWVPEDSRPASTRDSTSAARAVSTTSGPENGRSPESFAPGSAEIESLALRLVATVDHDPDSFTQGLVFGPDGRLYESAGRYGESDVREINPETGEVIRAVPLPVDVFAEGLAIGPDGLVQLSWKEGRAFRWKPDGLGALGEWRYDGEGWGLTYDASDRTFLRSDGSAVITRHDGDTFDEVGRLAVTRAGQPVDGLNELELVDGVLYANVWKSTDILRIDPDSGVVTGVIDASGIVPVLPDPEAVLNGIAHRPGDAATRLLVTGKDWPAMYVVDVATR